MAVISRILACLTSVGMVAPVCAVEPIDNPVAVRVGERVISRAMLDDAVNQALNASYYHGRMTAERRSELEQTQIDVLVRREFNFLGALERGLGLPETAAEQARFTIEERMGREAYEAALKSAGMAREGHRQALAETLLAQKAYQDFVLAPAEVSDDEVRVAFDSAPDHWRMPESAHVLHILVKVQPLADDESVARLLEQAESLKLRLGAGEDFGALAAKYSEDMYSIKGGDLGWVRRGQLVEELEKAVWASEIGEVMGPIRSSEGFHLAKVLGRRPARLMDFPEVEPMLREQLEKQKLEAAESAWFDPLRKKYPVVFVDVNFSEGNDPN